jgi:hypothetical protein
VIIVGCCCFCACRRFCARSAPAPAAASAIIRAPPASPSQARLGAGRPRRSPRLTQRLLPGCMRRNKEPEPGVSYRVADEEVQLRSAPADDDDDLPAIYHEASFAATTSTVAAVPPPPQYSTLPRAGRPASHGELSRRLSTLSQWMKKRKKSVTVTNKIQSEKLKRIKCFLKSVSKSILMYHFIFSVSIEFMLKSSAATRLVSQPANWPRFSLNDPCLLWSLLHDNVELGSPEVLRENPNSVVNVMRIFKKEKFIAKIVYRKVFKLCLVLSIGDGKFKSLLHHVRLRLSKCRRDVITIVCHQVGKRRSLPARCKRLREAASVFFLTAVFQGRWKSRLENDDEMHCC